jgi:uncharacterized protein with HEPN domain
MRPEDRHLGLLWDMQDYATLAAEMARGLSLDRLRVNRHDQLALAKALENIGEAANYLSAGFKAAHPEIPWPDIINLRHRIAHDYRNIDFTIIWDIVQNELPSLIQFLNEQLPPDTASDLDPHLDDPDQVGKDNE